jgi:hypothetical protein
MAAVLPAEAASATAHPVLAATAALRQRNKAAAGERRASATSSVLEKKREGDEMGTSETLRWSEMELPELDLSLDLGDRDCFFFNRLKKTR